MTNLASIGLALSFWVLCIGQTCGQQDKKQLPTPVAYDVHEWGVFTAPRDALWLKQDMAAEWATFPDFFHGIWPKKQLSYRGPVTKPVIYFHTQEKLRLQFEVHFAEGRPLIWWPPAEYPNTAADYLKAASLNKKAKSNSFLYFDLRINHGIEKQRKVAKDHWLNALRKVKSAPVTSYGSYSQFRQHYETREQESFVYYDGLMKLPAAPQVERTDRGIILKANSKHAWNDVVVLEREAGKLRIASKRIKRIEPGSSETIIEWQDISEKQLHELQNSQKKSWIAQGLHEDEAQSLLDVWAPGLFERQGITVFYRIDQQTYDAWLPIYSKPKPKKTVRVGLVVHYHLEPELKQKIKSLVADLGSNDFQVRNRADKRLREIGSPALKFLKAESENASPEVRMRCLKILKLEELENKTKELMEQFSGSRK